MENGFWINTLIYYASIASLITSPSIAAMTVAGLLFLAIPLSTEAEVMRGMRESMAAQIEVLKTQRYLNRERYYENLQ